jgi:hypothetical protein
MKSQWLFAWLLFCHCAALAQSKIILQPINSSVSPSALFGGERGYIFKYGDKDFEGIGRRGNNLKPYLTIDKDAMKAFKEYQRNHTIAWLSYAACLGGAVYGGYERVTYPNRPYIERRGTWAFWGGLALWTGFYVTLPFKLERSVAVYNANIR